MTPPQTTNVIDRHGGFTAESSMPYFMKRRHGLKHIGRFDMEGRKQAQEQALKSSRPARELPIGETLWRPGALLSNPTGRLLAYDEQSFYPLNDNVTVAIYKVQGYGYPVIVWFDNATGERIA